MSLRALAAPNPGDLIDDFLAGVAGAQGDVFAPIAVIVPNSTTRDWLIEQISTRSVEHGKSNIASNIRFMYPSEILGQRLVELNNPSADENNIAFAVRIYKVAKENPGLIPNFEKSNRPFRLAQRVARLFDRYVTHRPEMLAEWSKQAKPSLPVQHVWQWELWRKLALAPADTATLTDDELARFAKPLFIFGFGEVSPALAEAFKLLATKTDVIVHSIAPAPAARAKANFPLVQQWAGSSVSSLSLLDAALGKVESVIPNTSDTVLGQLQSRIFNDSAAGPVPHIDLEQLAPPTTDLSVQAHRCHGATRQIEVLRDAIFQMMARDPSLTPRDFVVVCPDLDRFAPLIDPVLGGDVGGKSLPVVIADRSQTTRNSLGLALSDLLEVARGRVSAADVLGLLAHPMIQSRFDLDADGVALITEWVADLDVRWGIDEEHRGAHWQDGANIITGTWRNALDRLLLGVLMQSTDLIEGPGELIAYDDISGTSIEVIGALTAFLSAVDDLEQDLRAEHTLEEWCSILERILSRFFYVSGDESQQIREAREAFEDLRKMASQAGDAQFIANDIVDYVNATIGNVRSYSAYWWHAVRVGNLVNFKSLPAKVMCVLGFDAVSLTTSGHDGDDLLSLNPQPGDPDPRASQRLHLLNAISSAQQSLIITCDGWDVKNNSKVPPAIAMEELLESIGATGADPGTGVIVDHPRQLADARSFAGVDRNAKDEDARRASRLTEKFGGPFSPSQPAIKVLEEIEAGRGSAQVADFDHTVYSDPPVERALTVDDLALALNHPYEVLVKQRFDIRLPSEEESASDEIDLAVTALEESQIGREMLKAMATSDTGLDKWKELRIKSGTLPPGALGTKDLSRIEKLVKELNGKRKDLQGDHQPEVRAFNNHFATQGVVVTGNATVYGHRIITTTYSKQKRSQLSGPWFTIASLTLEYPSIEWEAVVVSRTSDGDAVSETMLQVAGDSESARVANAEKIIAFGLEMRRRSLQSVLPLSMDIAWLIGEGATKTDVGDAIKALLKFNVAYQRVRGYDSLLQLRQEAPIQGFDDSLADGLLTLDQLDAEGVGYRARRYAKWLFHTWMSTTVEPGYTPPNNKGKKK